MESSSTLEQGSKLSIDESPNVLVVSIVDSKLLCFVNDGVTLGSAYTAPIKEGVDNTLG
jgi:hypothetical protein